MRASSWMGLAVLAGLGLAGTAQGAAIYTWSNQTVPADGSWNLPSNWGGSDYPHLQGDTAKFYQTTTGSKEYYIPLKEDITVGAIEMTENTNTSFRIGKTNSTTLESPVHKIIFDTGTGAPATWLRKLTTTSNNGCALRVESYCDLQLDSDLQIDWRVQRTAYLQGIISGVGKLSISYKQNSASNYFDFLAGDANSYEGGTELSGVVLATGDQPEIFRVFKNGVFGTGDVSLSAATLLLNHMVSSDDMIADGATLTLGAGAILSLADNVAETVAGLNIGTEPQAAGYWGSLTGTDSRIEYRSASIVGNGVLYVNPVSAPEPASIGVLGLGALLALRRRSRH